MMNKCMYSVKSKLKLSTLSLFVGWMVGVIADTYALLTKSEVKIATKQMLFFCVLQRRKQGVKHACCVWRSLLASCSPEKRTKITPVMRGSFFEQTRLVNEGLII